MGATIGDGVRTVYEFVWDDHTRQTSEIDMSGVSQTEATTAVEVLALLGEQDEDCTVNVTGFEET